MITEYSTRRVSLYSEVNMLLDDKREHLMELVRMRN